MAEYTASGRMKPHPIDTGIRNIDVEILQARKVMDELIEKRMFCGRRAEPKIDKQLRIVVDNLVSLEMEKG